MSTGEDINPTAAVAGATFQVGKYTISLSAPASESVRAEIWQAAASSEIRAYAAALGACWRGPGRPDLKYATYRYNALAFGGAFYEALRKRGVTYSQILAVGRVAYGLCSEGVLTEQELADLADFTEDQEESTG